MRSSTEALPPIYIFRPGLSASGSFIYAWGGEKKKKESDGSNGRLSVTVRKWTDLSTVKKKGEEELLSPGGCRSTDRFPEYRRPISNTVTTSQDNGQMYRRFAWFNLHPPPSHFVARIGKFYRSKMYARSRAIATLESPDG